MLHKSGFLGTYLLIPYSYVKYKSNCLQYKIYSSYMFGEYIHAFYIKQGNSSPIKDLPPTHSEANTPSTLYPPPSYLVNWKSYLVNLVKPLPKLSLSTIWLNHSQGNTA